MPSTASSLGFAAALAMQAEEETKVVARDLSETGSEDSGAVPVEVPDDVAADESDGAANEASTEAPTDEPRPELGGDETEAGAEKPAASASARGSAQIDLLTTHRLVGRYELIHRLGYGGMATVYLGRAIGTAGFERLVAVKVIHPHLASEPEFVEMFLDEARIAAKIHHPHVVEIIDLGQDDELFFMVMEYVEGENLAALLREVRKRKEPFPLSAALQIVSDVCGGLVAAHNLQDHDGTRLELVHRDVSPHNFLISMDGRVRVVDFGIMKAAGKRSTTLTGQLRGKVPYMSPEQAKGKDVDHRTDLFAVGAVLWEMLAGERLFVGQTESETLAKVLACEIPDLFELRDDLPAELRPVLDKALAPDPDDRYETAELMLKDVRAVLRQLDEDEPREVLAGSMKRFFKAKVDYIHATIRGYAAGDSASRSSASMSEQSVSRTTPAGLGSAAMARLTPSHPPVGAQTLTTSPGVTARQWPLWLLLPLAGAAIGTLVVRTWDTGGNQGQRDAPEAVDITPASIEPPKNDAAEAPTKPQTVKWWITSDPPGATLFINGKQHPKTTPVAIVVPRGDDPVPMRFEKDGYVVTERSAVPLGNQNIPIVKLEPLPSSTPESDTAESKAPMPVLRARTKPKGGAKKGKTSKPGPDTKQDPPEAADTKSSKSSSGEPELGDMPDFDVVRKKKTP